MRREGIKRTVIGFAGVAVFGVCLGGCPAVTAVTQGHADEMNALAKGADRLAAMQNPSGTWGSIITNATAPITSNGLHEDNYGLAGVNGQGLLAAYQCIGDPRYLIAAEKSGDYIVSTPISGTQSQNADEILFLYGLHNADLKSKYKTQADSIMNSLLDSKNNALASFDIDGSPGLSAQELFNAIEKTADEANVNGSQGERLITNPNGAIPYDLHLYVRDAQEYGNKDYAQSLAILIKTYVEQSAYKNGVDYYGLGLSAAVNGLEDGGLDCSSEVSRLLSQSAPQRSGSMFDTNAMNEGIIQASACLVMAFLRSGKMTEANAGVHALMKNQAANGGWIESDRNEYTQVDSEVIQAIAASISQ